MADYDFQFQQDARSALILNLGTLAANTYIATAGLSFSSSLPVDLIIEVVIDPNGTPTGNKQLLVFAKYSLDNVNWGSGPESGTTATNEADLDLIGYVSAEDTSEHRKFIRLFADSPPMSRYFKLVFKNELGVALTSGGVYAAEINAVNLEVVP